MGPCCRIPLGFASLGGNGGRPVIVIQGDEGRKTLSPSYKPVHVAATQKGQFIVLKNLTRAALATALLIAGLSSGLPASAQGYPPPPPPGYAPPPPPPGGVIVQTAPPPVRVEVVPPPPPYAAVWQPGFWRWDGYRYRWVRGHYVRPPRERHEWVAGHWEPRPGGHIWIEGFWR